MLLLLLLLCMQCGNALDDGCGNTITCGCTSGQVCSTGAARPGQAGVCYLTSCPPWQGGLYCGNTYYGRCGSNLASGCAGVGLNCPCPDPAHACTTGSSGTAGFCRQMPRGTDGACIDAPDVASVDTSNKAAVSALLASNFLKFQKCYLNGYLDPTCAFVVGCVLLQLLASGATSCASQQQPHAHGPGMTLATLPHTGCTMDHGFPGSMDTCTAFTTSAGWQKETEKMVNFYRAMAGVLLWVCNAVAARCVHDSSAHPSLAA